MKNSVKLSQWVLILIMAMSFYTCKKAESPNPTLSGPPATTEQKVANPYSPPAITFKTQVMGFVADVNGQPIQGAKVSANGQTATTDNYGVFVLDNAPFTGDFCYVKVEKQGYFIGSNTVHGEAGQKLFTEITMQAQDNIVVFPSGEGKDIVLNNGAAVKFPANAIKKADGSLYNGNVHVAVATIHPDDKNFSSLVPGGDLRAYTLAGENIQLYSFGMLNVELFDDAGNKLQLTEGKEATLTFPISNTQIAEATATIPLWYFDEDKGVWIEEGIAYKKGNNYVGNVKHFTPHNVDRPENRARISGRIVDCYGEPVGYTSFRAGQSRFSTNSKGEFTNVLVFANEPFELEYYNRNNYSYTAIKKYDGFKGYESKNDLGEIKFEKNCAAVLKAKVTDCVGKPFTGYAIIKAQNVAGAQPIPVVAGEFNTAGKYLSGYIEISFYSPSTQAIIVNSYAVVEGTINDFGTIRVCPENVGANKVGFSFTYTDGQTSTAYEIKNPGLAMATYSSSKDMTTVTFISPTSPADNISISFRGRMQGSFENSDTKNPAINMDLVSQGLKVKSYTDKINVTTYGDVGQEIKGSFTGRYLFTDNRWTVPKGMMITQGNFTAVRLPDVQ